MKKKFLEIALINGLMRVQVQYWLHKKRAACEILPMIPMIQSSF